MTLQLVLNHTVALYKNKHQKLKPLTRTTSYITRIEREYSVMGPSSHISVTVLYGNGKNLNKFRERYFRVIYVTKVSVSTVC